MSKAKELPEGQVDLSGKEVKKKRDEGEGEVEYLSLWKSALQKYIRRGVVDKAMYAAWKIAEKNWYIAWRRLSVIAAEDVCIPEAIYAIGELYRMFMASRRQNEQNPLSRDEKRLVIAAAKILAQSPKDRTADEFLETLDLFENEETANLPEVKARKEELEKFEDYVFDVHTVKGRKMGRGEEYWYETSRKVENPAITYIKYADWVYEIRKKHGKL